MKLILILTFSIVTIFSLQAKKYDLQLNLEKGTTYTQNMHSDMTISQNFNGNEMKISMVMDGVIEYSVLTDVDGLYDLEVKYSKLGILMDMPQMKMDFGSGKVVNDTLNNMMSLMFDNIVGKVFTMKLTNKGEVKEVAGLSEIFAKMFDGLPNLSAEKQAELSNQVIESFGEESFKQNVEMSTGILPKEIVKLGATWSKSTTIESSLTFNMETVYTLIEAKGDFYVLSATSTITSAGSEEYEEKNEMLMKQKLNGISTAEIKLDKQTGWTVWSKTTQDIKGNSYMKQSLEGEEMVIPLVLEGETVITNLK